MTNTYETVFILTPVLSEDQMKETVEKFKGILAENGAEITSEEHWGMKKLAYPIEKKSSGFYVLMEFKAEPVAVTKLEKYAQEWAEKRRQKYASKKED